MEAAAGDASQAVEVVDAAVVVVVVVVAVAVRGRGAEGDRVRC